MKCFRQLRTVLGIITRANYQTFIWRSSLVAMQDLQSPEHHGSEKEDYYLRLVNTTKDTTPRSLFEINIHVTAGIHCVKAIVLAPI